MSIWLPSVLCGAGKTVSPASLLKSSLAQRLSGRGAIVTFPIQSSGEARVCDALRVRPEGNAEPTLQDTNTHNMELQGCVTHLVLKKT